MQRQPRQCYETMGWPSAPSAFSHGGLAFTKAFSIKLFARKFSKYAETMTETRVIEGEAKKKAYQACYRYHGSYVAIAVEAVLEHYMFPCSFQKIRDKYRIKKTAISELIIC